MDQPAHVSVQIGCHIIVIFIVLISIDSLVKLMVLAYDFLGVVCSFSFSLFCTIYRRLRIEIAYYKLYIVVLILVFPFASTQCFNSIPNCYI